MSILKDKNDSMSLSTFKEDSSVAELKLNDTIQINICEIKFLRSDTMVTKSKLSSVGNKDQSKKSTNYREVFSIPKNKDCSFQSENGGVSAAGQPFARRFGAPE